MQIRICVCIGETAFINRDVSLCRLGFEKKHVANSFPSISSPFNSNESPIESIRYEAEHKDFNKYFQIEFTCHYYRVLHVTIDFYSTMPKHFIANGLWNTTPGGGKFLVVEQFMNNTTSVSPVGKHKSRYMGKKGFA